MWCKTFGESDRRAKLTVKVFSTQAAMARGLRRYHKTHGELYQQAWYRNTAAATSPYSRRKDAPGSPWRYEVTIWLTAGNCGTEIVTHECAHAAVYLYQNRLRRSIRDMKDEEEFCYMVGAICRGVVTGLYALGLYDEAA